jgi:hypothetical protein
MVLVEVLHWKLLQFESDSNFMFFPSSEDLMFLVITSLKCVFVKGVGKIYKFWGLQGIMDKNRPLDNWGFKF